jgi:hypothetical protein
MIDRLSRKNPLSGLGFDFPVMNMNIQGRNMKDIVEVLDYLLWLEIYTARPSSSGPIQRPKTGQQVWSNRNRFGRSLP